MKPFVTVFFALLWSIIAIADEIEDQATILAKCGGYSYVLADMAASKDKELSDKMMIVGETYMKTAFIELSKRQDHDAAGDSIYVNQAAATAMEELNAALRQDFNTTLDKWHAMCEPYQNAIERIAFSEERTSTLAPDELVDEESWVNLAIFMEADKLFVKSIMRIVFSDKMACNRAALSAESAVNDNDSGKEKLWSFCLPPNVPNNYADVEVGGENWVMMQLFLEDALSVDSVDFFELSSMKACVTNMSVILDMQVEDNVLAFCLPPNGEVEFTSYR